MPKADKDRHTHFISCVFTPSEGSAIEAAAKRAHLKKSAWIRQIALKEIERGRRRRK